MTKKSRYKPIPLVLILLEAAIGIEPMNKGFAVLAQLFAQFSLVCLCPFLLGLSKFPSLRVID